MKKHLSIFQIISILFIASYFSGLNVFGQNGIEIPYHNANHLIIKDSLITDTTKISKSISIYENLLFTVDDSLMSKTENFYDTLKHRADKRKIIREILDLIVVTPSDDTVKIASESETPFIDYHHKIIRSINFKQLPVFGPTLEDTAIQANRLYEKTGNKLHINTSKNIIKKYLLIKPGDELNAYKLADNERIIRSLPFIHDVRFMIRQTDPLSDSVDILVLTKDLWSLGFGAEISGIDKGKIGIWHKNLFGFGNEEHNTIFWNTNEKSLLGFEGTYRVINLAGLFITSEFRYANYFGTRQIYADFQRNFFTPEIKYAGGIRFNTKKTIRDIVLIDTILFQSRYNFTSYDIWAGRAFPLSEGGMFTRKRSNLMLAGRVNSIIYHERPNVESDYLYAFHNRSQLLVTAAISSQGFYKSHLIYSFGQTEDIPYGYLIQILGGYEFNEYYQRPYLGFALSHGTYLWSKGGYLLNKFETGGFFSDNSYDQGLFSISTNYFTPLFSSNRFKFRYFVKFNYKTGIQRFREEYISIENKQGLTGLSSPNLKGIQKITLNLEAVTFTPYYFLGFRFVFFGFADAGMIGPGNKPILTNKLYSGLGFGIRIRNERLVFNTVQIKFAFFPLAPEDAEWQYIQFSGEQKLRMENFYISEPKIIEF